MKHNRRRKQKKDAATKEKETKVEINQEKGGAIEGDTPAAKIAEWVEQKLSSGERFTFADLTKIANEAFGRHTGRRQVYCQRCL